jgi:hypothetical protein
MASEAALHSALELGDAELTSIDLENFATWKVVAMRGCVGRIKLDGADYVEASLLKAKGHASDPSKEVNGDWSFKAHSASGGSPSPTDHVADMVGRRCR